MRAETDETQVSVETPVEKPKFSIVIILAVLLGVLLTVVIAGGIVFVQQRDALKTEVVEASKKLKEKDQALADMQRQLEELSMQMLTLKEYAIARSGSARKIQESTKAVVPEGTPGTNDRKAPLPLPETGDNARADIPPVKPKEESKKTKPAKAEPSSTSCELVGKSPKEQEEILRRCVGLMDGTIPEKKRSR